MTPAQFASGMVVLTTAHLNHYPPDCRPSNLLVMCNTCHLRYDQVLHSKHAWRTKRERAQTEDMFES